MSAKKMSALSRQVQLSRQPSQQRDKSLGKLQRDDNNNKSLLSQNWLAKYVKKVYSYFSDFFRELQGHSGKIRKAILPILAQQCYLLCMTLGVRWIFLCDIHCVLELKLTEGADRPPYHCIRKCRQFPWRNLFKVCPGRDYYNYFSWKQSIMVNLCKCKYMCEEGWRAGQVRLIY